MTVSNFDESMNICCVHQAHFIPHDFENHLQHFWGLGPQLSSASCDKVSERVPGASL